MLMRAYEANAALSGGACRRAWDQKSTLSALTVA